MPGNFDSLKGWRLHNFSGQNFPVWPPLTVKGFLFWYLKKSKRFFLIFQFVPTSILSVGTTEKPGSISLVLFYQTFQHTDKNPASLLKSKLSSCSLTLYNACSSLKPFTRLTLACPYLSCTGEPGLDTTLQVWSHCSWAEGNDHLLCPVISTLPSAIQGATDHLCHSWRQKLHLFPSSLQEPLPITMTFQRHSGVALEWHQAIPEALKGTSCQVLWSSVHPVSLNVP